MEIKKIVKSDGTVVDFDSSKLNKWAEYASQNNVDWSSIAVESYRKCFDGCTTMDLQNAMIATCIEKEKDEYMNMAGRLLIGSIYKEVHGGFRSIPTLKEFYHDMVERGFWEKMDYTNEELDELESVINHDRNLEYSYTSLHQMRNKYLMKIEGSNVCLESPQFMFMGIAMASFELEDKEHRLEDVKKFYKYSSEMKINIATPMLVNLRSPSKGLASCCVYTAGDTIDSLSAGDLIAYHMTANSAGIGSHVNSRSIGDPVKQGRVLHQGKLPYYRMIQSAVHANKQACYDKETEVLTENGFKLFSELEDELIAQVNDDGTMEFVEKEDFFQYDNVEKLHRFDILGKSILVTDNHRMTIIEDEEFNENESPNFDGNNFKEVEAKDLELTENIYFKHGITSNNKYVNNEDVTVNILKYLNRLGKLKSFEIDRSEGQEFNTFLIELNNVVDYFGTKTEIDTIIENIEKRFEGEVFTDLMERCDKKSMFKFKVDTKIDLTLKDEELLKMSSVDAIGILHILQYFVSTEVGSQLVFWKLEKDGVDFVQLIAMLSNLKTTTYFESEDGTETVHIGSSSMTNGKFVLKEEVDYNDTVYCVQVPSGRVVVRRDGLVLVCGNSRGGANTTYFPCIDPEVMDLLVLKNPTTIVSKRIREIDYALSVNRLFVERVAKNGDWYTISRYYAPDLYEAFYSGDYDKFVEMYEKYEDHEKSVKYKAREIATKALVESAETGRIYMHYVDEANRHTPFKETIYSSNLCVAPETKILTDKGNIEISTLVDQKVNVWNGEEWSETIVRKTSPLEHVVQVKADDGSSIDCTNYHKWYVVSRDKSGKVGKTVEKRTHELVVGDELIKPSSFEMVNHGENTLPFSYESGFYSGDGCERGRTDYKHSEITFYTNSNKMHLIDSFSGYSSKVVTEKYTTLRFKHGTLLKKLSIPDSNFTLKSRVEWLAGLADADGCELKGGESFSITTSSQKFSNDLKLFLQEIGVSCTCGLYSNSKTTAFLPKDSVEYKEVDRKPLYVVRISAKGTTKLLSMGLSCKRLKLKASSKSRRTSSKFVKIESITDYGRKTPVYCFTEKKRNMGMFNGILTGNCNEIALPTKPFSSPADLYSDDPDGEIALCSLSSLVLGRISDEEYEDVAYYAVKFVDNTITIMDYPFPSLKVTANKRRNLGIGMTNLAYHMAKNKKSYATLEGKKFIHEVAEKHAFWVYKASLRLAKEKGVCDWINRTKFPEGWLPIDTYNKNLDEVVPNDLKMDWEGLRKEMIEVGGLRNSVLIAIAPNESSSQLTNTTNSVYPIRNLRVVKTSGNTKNVLIAPEAKELEHFYDIAWDLSSKDIIELYGICQKFIDQSLSADLYIDFRKSDKISVKNLLTDFVRMMKLGCKGRYYINSNSGVTSSELDEPSCEGCTM